MDAAPKPVFRTVPVRRPAAARPGIRKRDAGGGLRPGSAGVPLTLVIPAKAGIHAFLGARASRPLVDLRAFGLGAPVRCLRDTRASRKLPPRSTAGRALNDGHHGHLSRQEAASVHDR